jgi:hypothetical protein
MATLETQYENFLLENPELNITFEEWKVLLGKQLEQVIKEIEENK